MNSVRRDVYELLRGESRHKIWGRVVEQSLFWLIIVNCVLSMMETIERLTILHGSAFRIFDYFSVGVFTVEYLTRLWTSVEDPDARFHHPLWGRLRFMVTPFALVDFLVILPFYCGLFVKIDLRSIRVLRLLQILKLSRHSEAMTIIGATLRKESRAIGAVLVVFVILTVFLSSLIYLVEHPLQPHVFSDVPTSMWWAVETMTTVGYGDMVPISTLGRIIGGFTAIVGIGMIALPSGILASGLNEQLRLKREEYEDSVGKAVGSGKITAKTKRHLEEVRLELGLSQEDAARILRHAVEAEKSSSSQ